MIKKIGCFKRSLIFVVKKIFLQGKGKKNTLLKRGIRREREEIKENWQYLEEISCEKEKYLSKHSKKHFYNHAWENQSVLNGQFSIARDARR